ncbi:MAG: hypothetical protein HGB11_02235 [Chlorobiales bacterium]|nr:hypothetical protein [Chlorobiales bacterium]
MRPFLPLMFIALLLGLFACGEDKTINDPAGTPPSVVWLDSVRLGDSAITELNLDDFLTNANLSNFNLGLHSSVVRGENGNPSVTAILYAPGTTDEVATSELTSTPSQGDTIRFEGNVSVSLDRTAVGTYTVVVVAEDEAGQAGVGIRTKIRFYKNNLPPQLVRVNLSSDTINVTLPPYLDTLIVTAEATDPDGRSDISAVQVLVGTTPFPMYDDGNFTGHGDRFVGDGIYSRGFSISSANTTGPRTLRFRVIDNSGEISNVIEKTFYIKSPN